MGQGQKMEKKMLKTSEGILAAVMHNTEHFVGKKKNADVFLRPTLPTFFCL